MKALLCLPEVLFRCPWAVSVGADEFGEHWQLFARGGYMCKMVDVCVSRCVGGG